MSRHYCAKVVINKKRTSAINQLYPTTYVPTHLSYKPIKPHSKCCGIMEKESEGKL